MFELKGFGYEQLYLHNFSKLIFILRNGGPVQSFSLNAAPFNFRENVYVGITRNDAYDFCFFQKTKLLKITSARLAFAAREH